VGPNRYGLPTDATSMDDPGPDEARVDAALREERGLVLSLGGYAVELSGGVLVVNERIPVPRFNFVQQVTVSRSRQSAFLEWALDHYFQRALRPSFRLEESATAGPFRATLEKFGFRSAGSRRLLLRTASGVGAIPPSSLEVGGVPSDDLPAVAAFWTGERERAEFLRALDVVVHHPNPQERLLPVWARSQGAPVAAGLWHRFEAAYGIHGIATRPEARGQGAATGLVAWVLAHEVPPEARVVAIWADSDRLERGLVRLGFETVRRYTEFSLPPDAELALPPAAAPGPPRWRPPRSLPTGAGRSSLGAQSS
jgi:GNAT superfamily N-acetyltransferase